MFEAPKETDIEEVLLSAAIAHVVSRPRRGADDPDMAVLRSKMQGRSMQAFKALYDLTSPRMLRVILRINRNRDDADEILQDVYVQAWMRSAQFDARRGSVMMRSAQFDERRGSVMAWLTSIAQHKAVSSLRGRACRLKSVADSSRGLLDEDEGSSSSSEDLEPPASAARAHALRAVQEGIDALPSEQRLCVVLAFFDDLTHSEIAVRVGRPMGTVKSWLRRSLHGMRPVLAAH